MKKNTLLCLVFLASCSDALPIDARIAELETAPISGLSSYASGKVLHPWYFGRPDGERKWELLPGAASGRMLALILLLLFVGCGNSPQPHPPRPQVCGLLGDSCDKQNPCCRAVNGAPIECFDGACEYK